MHLLGGSRFRIDTLAKCGRSRNLAAASETESFTQLQDAIELWFRDAVRIWQSSRCQARCDGWHKCNVLHDERRLHDRRKRSVGQCRSQCSVLRRAAQEQRTTEQVLLQCTQKLRSGSAGHCKCWKTAPLAPLRANTLAVPVVTTPAARNDGASRARWS